METFITTTISIARMGLKFRVFIYLTIVTAILNFTLGAYRRNGSAYSISAEEEAEYEIDNYPEMTDIPDDSPIESDEDKSVANLEDQMKQIEDREEHQAQQSKLMLPMSKAKVTLLKGISDSDSVERLSKDINYKKKQLQLADDLRDEISAAKQNNKQLKHNDEAKMEDCWMSLDSESIFNALNDLDEQYENVRRDYEHEVAQILDRKMLQALLSAQGAAPRTINKFGGNPMKIPAGINLGGHSMMRQKNSILFFHRVKLRNSTNFHVNYLHNDLMNMALIGDLALNDLHLVGAYERSVTHNDPSVLWFRPTSGNLELLLKNVSYHMEARMRLMFDRMTIEVINSEMKTNGILISFLNNNASRPEYTRAIDERDIDNYLQRLKTDLDLWMKDYFNDYLMHNGLPDYDHTEFQKSETKKTLHLAEFTNTALDAIRERIRYFDGNAIKLPSFTIFSIPGLTLKITKGMLRGLDSMYQRSVATSMRNGVMLIIDLLVTFSKLKVEYMFEAIMPDGSPSLSGSLLLTPDELAAHLEITLVEKSNTVDLSFDCIQHMKSEFLTVEGPVNRLIANYRHILENEILAIMSNTLIHHIKMLNTLPRCEPFLHNDNNDSDERGAKHFLKYEWSNKSTEWE